MAPYLHQPPDLFHDLIGARDDPRDDVAMAVQVFRRRMDDDVGAVLERPEIHGRRERRIHDQRESFFLAERGDRLEIDDAHQRIGRCLEKDGARRLAHRALPGARLRGIHERDVDPELAEFFAKQPVHAAIDPFAREQMIAGAQHREVRERGGRHAAGEKERRVGAFDQRQPAADVDLIGVVAITAVQDFGGGSDGIGEGGALV